MRLTPEQTFSTALEPFCESPVDHHIGVAVSGGSDSLAMLVLAHAWARNTQFKITALTVDHNLRAGAAQEIAHVAHVCADLDVTHRVFTWNDWDGTGNLQSQARGARLDLLEAWCATHHAACVLLGHTADDQAETVLMHLARGSGVDGLAGIQRRRGCFVRPVLDVGRDDLRALLQSRGITWCDDPSNEDLQFDRVKVRQMMGHLADLGLTRDRLVQTAHHMRGAQDSLIDAAADFAKHNTWMDGGDLILPKRVFQTIASDMSARIVSAALMWIGGQTYRARYVALCEMGEAITRGEARTLQGVRIGVEGETVRLSRELCAIDHVIENVAPESLRQSPLMWDGRWQITASEAICATDVTFLSIRALGEAIKDVPDWRNINLPRASLMATPAVFQGDSLVAAPVAGHQCGFQARIVADLTSFLLCR